jgi:hypothetical protein
MFRRRQAKELAEKVGDARGLRGLADLSQIFAEAGALLDRRSALSQSGRVPNELAQQQERRAGADRIRAREQDARLALPVHARDELVAKPGLTLSGRSRHEYEASDRLVDAFAQRELEQAELLVAPHERADLTHQESRRLGVSMLANEHELASVTLHLKARVE